MTFKTLLGYIVLVAFWHVEALAVNFLVAPSPSSDIVISKADATFCPESMGASLDPSIQVLRNFSFVVTNRSSRGLTVLTAVWKVVDQAGHTTKHSFLSDSYTFPKLRYVIPAHGAAVLWPLSMSVQQPGGGWVSSPMRSDTRRAELFSTANSVEVAVDVVAFEDGRFAGSDTQRTIENIVARHETAKYVAGAIRQAPSSGRPVQQVLRELGQRGVPGAPAQTVHDLWKRRFSSMAAKDVEPGVRYLENFPDLPQFVRNSQ